MDFAASNHVSAIHLHAGAKLIDCVVLNTAPIPQNLRRRYARAHLEPVENDFRQLTEIGVKVVTAELIAESSLAQRRIRHDPEALAAVVIDLAKRSRALRVKKWSLHERLQYLEKQA